jgi:hypothetical protein
MENQQILEKLNSYIKKFQESDNSFMKVVAFHDYFSFVKSSTKLNELLGTIIDRGQANSDIIFSEKEIEHITLGDLGYKNGGFRGEDIIWILFSFYMFIYQKMENYKTADSNEKQDIEKLLAEEITRPDLMPMTASFFMLVHQYIITLLNKEMFASENYNKIIFNEERSILNFYGQSVNISKYKNPTKGHYVLKHIFIKHKDEIDGSFPFSEIHDEEFEDKYSEARYITAINDINEKIKISTPNNTSDFLEFGKGKTSEVWINKKYLDDVK